jgi:hypothetical protein
MSSEELCTFDHGVKASPDILKSLRLPNIVPGYSVNGRQCEMRTRWPDELVLSPDYSVAFHLDEADRTGTVAPIIGGFKIDSNELEHRHLESPEIIRPETLLSGCTSTRIEPRMPQ